MATVNKQMFIEKIAEKCEISKKDAAVCVNAVFDTVTEIMVNGDKLQLIGFGTFETSTRAAREGKNPRTGETVKIAASTAPKFKPGKALKDAVNK